MGHPVDRLMSGLFLAALVTMSALFALSMIPVGSFNDGLGLWHVAAGLAVAACIVFPRPLLLCTLLRAKRSPFLLDVDVNSMLIGRVMGLVFGVLGTVWLYRLTG
ncbi:MAG: hypothetical protein AB1704_06970 [Pseudomonadota bacterium]|jgi:hypothetical protein|uniref:hypothetical protein n=1 Tax=Burkholderiaceae TaxID=119060 RepID=UPI0010F49FD2|nr:hypothetical protein [Burkholderia sp. 4M9327F10]